MSDAVKRISPNYKNLFAVCCIFPATPLLSSNDLKKSFKIFKKKKWEYVFGAIKYSHPPQRGFFLNKNNSINMISRKKFIKNDVTQNFKNIYHDAGQFYWAKSSTWIKKKKVFSNKSTVYLKSNSDYIDIDTIEDWKKAEITYSYKNKFSKFK